MQFIKEKLGNITIANIKMKVPITISKTQKIVVNKIYRSFAFEKKGQQLIPKCNNKFVQEIKRKNVTTTQHI